MFQSTRPAWGATLMRVGLGGWGWFQSTRPAWGATLLLPPSCSSVTVSIHAPRVGRDIAASRSSCSIRCFNPRAPRGARPLRGSAAHPSPLFQSTRPAWGATTCGASIAANSSSFNPRAPRGARRVMAQSLQIRIVFQSTRPAWGATSALSCTARRSCGFNPRAPRGARPVHRRSRLRRAKCFNPRAPRGARRWPCCFCNLKQWFQSTRPAWGATEAAERGRRGKQFQSTRPAWGAT